MNVASKAKQGEYKGYAIKDYPFAPARHPPSPATERFEGAKSLVAKKTSPEFVGVTTDGKPKVELFPVHRTGVSTEAIVKAAQHFLSTLSESQRAAVSFSVDAQEWRHVAELVPVCRAARRDAGATRQPAARRGTGTDARVDEQPRLRGRARHDARQRKPRRDHRAVGGVRRVDLLDQHHGHAIRGPSRGGGRSTGTI